MTVDSDNMTGLQFTLILFLFLLPFAQVKSDSETNIKDNVARLVRGMRERSATICRGKGNNDQVNLQSAFSFFQCINGKAVLRRCPPEESFDPGSSTCVPLGNSTMCENMRYQKIPHPDDEKKYFRCQGGKAFEQTCRNGFIFDKLYRSCNIEWWVRLHSSITTTKPTTTLSIDERCRSVKIAMFADEKDKSGKRYYKCFFGKLWGPYKCYSWMVYDRNLNRCGFKWF